MKTRLRMLRLPAVKDKVGLGTSGTYELTASGFSEISIDHQSAVGWFEHEIDEWPLSRPLAMLEVAKKGGGQVSSAGEAGMGSASEAL